ncbi:MAG: hypothetical protein ACTSSN_04735 [Candidatus Heimdallarchaeaceae archaeon]
MKQMYKCKVILVVIIFTSSGLLYHANDSNQLAWQEVDIQEINNDIPVNYMAFLKKTCEYNPAIKYLDQSIIDKWNIVVKPFFNRDRSYYYSYQVGYGSLDVQDMIEFVADLS